MMSAVKTFFFKTQGKKSLSLVDWISYFYLLLGFLIIFLPVMWLAMNSIKSQFLLQKLDTNILPLEYDRIARATVYNPEGKDIFFIKDMPRWVLYWNDLSAEEKALHDPHKFLEKFNGNEFYALRSHFGLVSGLAKKYITENNLPDWLLKYPSMFPNSKKEHNPELILETLNIEDQRLLSEFLGLNPYKSNGFTAQILVTAPDPESGNASKFAVNRLQANKETVRARPIESINSKMVTLQTSTLKANTKISPSWKNYINPLTGNLGDGGQFNAVRCLNNSIIVTIIATIITVLINSMAAFALSKYRFNGQIIFFIIILATLMVPASVLMVGIFKMISLTGLSGSLWGVIIPGAATPTGVFMLRQYMLTIPDELLEAARMDAASEWTIYWRIVFPLALPAIAVLTILSIIWRWNDLILPMIAVSTTKAAYTIQLCLLDFSGEYVSQEHYRLAMTVVSLIPTTIVFVFLQRYITTGIANTGIK
jgi:alpha-1,4-digalacturonate transport system permease protein